FHGTYRANGMDVRILFTWSDITPTTAAWSQSFSIDDGQTWERNWEMEFTRIAA
ncbi:MAG: hypothetical protein IT335_05285, partial [Thermomicrobiales bacterium]|nr:hypothetical protein [Thermomicrobiales bacterium]